MIKYGFPQKVTILLKHLEAKNNEINEKIAHIKPPNYSNLLNGEQKALEYLQEKHDTAIVNADEGGAVVIMDVTDYTEKAERELNKMVHYRQLSKDQTAAINESVNNVIESFQGLKNTLPRTPRLHIQPEIHKQGNLGRPVTSSVNCHT